MLRRVDQRHQLCRCCPSSRESVDHVHVGRRLVLVRLGNLLGRDARLRGGACAGNLAVQAAAAAAAAAATIASMKLFNERSGGAWLGRPLRGCLLLPRWRDGRSVAACCCRRR